MKLHVCSLPGSMSKNDIIELFEVVGPVDQFKYSGAHALHCVEFEMTPADAYSALSKYDGIEFDEVAVQIRVK